MTKLTDRFEDALVYATRLHANQVRKASGVPYIAHLLSVVALVLEDGGTEDEAIAALLHDAIEDQGGWSTREAIQQRFGETVSLLVEGCTEPYGSPKPPWSERKRRYIEQLRQASPSVRRVSLADKLHNAQSLLKDWQQQGEAIWSNFKGGKAATLAFYDNLLQVYRETGSTGYMVEELERVIAELYSLFSEHSEKP